MISDYFHEVETRIDGSKIIADKNVDLMDKEGKMVFRYDNAPHHEISTFPCHKHLPGIVEESP